MDESMRKMSEVFTQHTLSWLMSSTDTTVMRLQSSASCLRGMRL